MEPVGAISEVAWNSFTGMCSTEEADFMAQLLGNFSLPNESSHSSSFGISSTFWPSLEPNAPMGGNAEGSFCSTDNTDTNTNYFSQGSSYNDGNAFLFRTSSGEDYYPNDSLGDGKATISTIHVLTNNNLVEGDDFLNQEMSSYSIESSGVNLPEAILQVDDLQLGRESEISVPEPSKEDSNLSENSRKRPISSSDIKEGKRNVKSRKIHKSLSTSNIEEANNALARKQSTSSYCSEDESNGSQELNGGLDSSPKSEGTTVLNSSGKSRASRGSATDPQSLYARKRRERINERLRILQNLVPNGTKVDISTMLEEAVQYVKFLQLQIKLLSSDDMWMYAPIAYNGMDIGLDLKISGPR